MRSEQHLMAAVQSDDVSKVQQVLSATNMIARRYVVKVLLDLMVVQLCGCFCGVSQHSGVSQQCMTWHMYKLCANNQKTRYLVVLQMK